MAISGSSVIGFRSHVRRLRRMRRRARMHTSITAPLATQRPTDRQEDTHFLVRQIRQQAAKLVVQRAAQLAT